ncbi:1-aminocyclopropane-1-carboxylate deaminase OS=Streptomyces albaduncus OX=68172 GN=FHS32_004812 PE=3 SV=1 [Streptomyces griseoloalbus]
MPEGGSNAAAVRGCVELGRELAGAADVAAVACGTGGALAGLAAGLGARARSAYRCSRASFLTAEIRALQTEAFGGTRGEWFLDERFHHGGYARVPADLEAFAADFEQRHGVPVERLYVAKLYALVALAGEGAPCTQGARSPR